MQYINDKFQVHPIKIQLHVNDSRKYSINEHASAKGGGFYNQDQKTPMLSNHSTFVTLELCNKHKRYTSVLIEGV